VLDVQLDRERALRVEEWKMREEKLLSAQMGAAKTVKNAIQRLIGIWESSLSN
jgi:hypothetical protein